jgi:hypothetical protein
MTSCMIDVSDRPRVSDRKIVDIAVEFLFDDRSMSECRGHLLSEYDVSADDLDRLLDKARSELRACDVEFNTRLRF